MVGSCSYALQEVLEQDDTRELLVDSIEQGNHFGFTEVTWRKKIIKRSLMVKIKVIDLNRRLATLRIDCYE